MAGEDGEGAVDLLGEDGAGHFMGQGDIAEGQDKSGASACGGRPAVGGADGKDEGLRTGVAEAAEVSGEVAGGELLATAVEENEDRSGTARPGRLVQRGEQGSFGGVGEGVAGEVAGGAGDVVGGESCGGVGLCAGAGWRDCGEKELHSTEGIKVVNERGAGNYD